MCGILEDDLRSKECRHGPMDAAIKVENKIQDMGGSYRFAEA